MPDWIQTSLSVDWIALGVSLLAIVLSVFALRQNKRFRTGDQAMEAGRLSAEIGEQLGDLASRVPKVKANWHALMAANGNFHSGARQQLDNEMEQALADVTSLRARLADLSGDFPQLGPTALEQRLVQLWSLKLAANRIEGGIAEREAKHQQGVDARRAAINR